MGFFSNSSDDEKYSEQRVEASSRALSSGQTAFDLSLSDVNKEITNQINNVFNSSGFQSIWNELKPFDRWEQWGNFKRGRGAVGLKAYSTPSLTDYSNCVKNDGASVWDENGWWRCLFPKGRVTNSDELTREDIEGDSGNKYGLFFKNYNDLLDWKLKVRDLVREKEETEKKLAREAREASNIQGIYDEYAKDVDFPAENDVVSTSKSVYFKTLPNGDAEETTKLQKVFRDGTVQHQDFRKLIPRDGSLPVVEDLSPTEKDSKKLTGWIWDDK